MSPEIPSGFRYEEFLPHLFPGFFAAIASFMLIDVMSPFDFTSWAVKSIGGLAGFVGFIVLFGTILGVIIDIIHHLIIEDAIFDNLREIKKIKILIKELYPIEEQEHLTHNYFLKKLGSVDIEEYIAKGLYHYTEFFANTFSSLFYFSFIVPYYLFYVLKVNWISSALVALMSFIFAITCLYKSCDTYKKYLKKKYSIILGYLGHNYPKNPVKCDNKKDCLWVSITIKILFVGVIVTFITYGLTISIFDAVILIILVTPIIYFSYLYVNSGIIGWYIFNWDEIPGKDDDVLKRHLIRYHNADWVRKSKFKKCTNDTTIYISNKLNYIKLDLVKNDKNHYNVTLAIVKQYLFSWKNIPGNDNGRLIEFLIQNFGIEWVRAAKITKSDDDMTIEVDTGTNVLSLKLDEKRSKVTLKIDNFENKKISMNLENGEIYICNTEINDEFDVRKENCNINIYKNNRTNKKETDNNNPLTIFYCGIKNLISSNVLIIDFTFSLTLLVLSFILLIILSIFTPPQIIIEPKNFEEQLTSGNRSIQLSIKNIGADLTNVNLSIEGINDWISLNPGNFLVLKNKDIQFVQVNLTPQNETVGEFRGAITIKAKTYGNNVTEQHIEELIPEAIPEFKFIIRIK